MIPASAAHREDFTVCFAEIALAARARGEQTLERLGIKLERALRALRRAQADGAIDLPAFEFAHQALAQLGLRCAQLVGQPEAALEEAMVHAAQLADKRSPGPAASHRANPVMLVIMWEILAHACGRLSTAYAHVRGYRLQSSLTDAKAAS